MVAPHFGGALSVSLVLLSFGADLRKGCFGGRVDTLVDFEKDLVEFPVKTFSAVSPCGLVGAGALESSESFLGNVCFFPIAPCLATEAQKEQGGVQKTFRLKTRDIFGEQKV